MSLVPGNSETDTAVKMWSHQGWVGGNIAFFNLLVSLFLMQTTMPKGTLLAHLHLDAHQALQVFFCKASLVHLQHTWLLHWHVGLSLPRCKKWTSFGWISWGSSLLISPACWGPSQWQTTISYTSSSSQCCIISRLAELTLCPIIQVFNKDIKKHWSLGHSSSDWSLAVHHATDHNPLNLIFQLVLGRMVRHYSPLQISDNSNHLFVLFVFGNGFQNYLLPYYDLSGTEMRLDPHSCNSWRHQGYLHSSAFRNLTKLPRLFKDFSKSECGLKMTLDHTLSTHRHIFSAPMDLCMSRLFRCSLTWSAFSMSSLPCSRLPQWFQNLWFLKARQTKYRVSQSFHILYQKALSHLTLGPCFLQFLFCCWPTGRSLSCCPSCPSPDSVPDQL